MSSAVSTCNQNSTDWRLLSGGIGSLGQRQQKMSRTALVSSFSTSPQLCLSRSRFCPVKVSRPPVIPIPACRYCICKYFLWPPTSKCFFCIHWVSPKLKNTHCFWCFACLTFVVVIQLASLRSHNDHTTPISTLKRRRHYRLQRHLAQSSAVGLQLTVFSTMFM